MQKLLIEILFGLMHQQACHTAVIELGPPCSSNHLQDICYREIYIPFKLTVIELGAFHNH